MLDINPGDISYGFPRLALAIIQPTGRSKPIFLVIRGVHPDGVPDCIELSINIEHTSGAYAEWYQRAGESILDTKLRMPDKLRRGLISYSNESVIHISPSRGQELESEFWHLPSWIHERSRFELWNIWSCHPDNLTTRFSSIPKILILQLKHRITSMLGLSSQSAEWIPPHELDADAINNIRGNALIKRGEVIHIALPPSGNRMPLIAIGDDFINGFNRKRILALSTTRYLPHHDTSDIFVPLPDKSRSIALKSIRGMQIIMNRTTWKTNTFLDSETLAAVTKKMKAIYA